MTNQEWAEWLVDKILAMKPGERASIAAMRLKERSKRYDQRLFAEIPAKGIDRNTRMMVVRVIAPMIAHHPQHSDGGMSFGYSAAMLSRKSSRHVGKDMDYLATVDRLEKGEAVLWGLVNEMKKCKVPVNWTRFIMDTIYWKKTSFYEKWYSDYTRKGSNND